MPINAILKKVGDISSKHPLLAILGSIALLMLVLPLFNIYGTRVSGTLVDAESGKPISDAVIYAQWTATHGLGLTYHTVSKVGETESDENGRFVIGGPLNCLGDPPTVVIYKKGYEVWNNEYLFPSMKRRYEPVGQITVQNIEIRMNTFKAPYLKAEPEQSDNFASVGKNNEYKWDGKSPLNPLYSHTRNIEFIDTFTSWPAKRIRAASAWELSQAKAEKNLVIKAELRCKVVDATTGKPIKGAVIDTEGCRKSPSKDKRCDNLTDANGNGYIKLSAPFLIKPPRIEVYKNGYWLYNFDKFDHWVAWSKMVDGFVFRLEQCPGYTQSYCAPYEINP